MLEIVRLPGVPLTDPAWGEARKGRPPANAGQVFPPEVLSAQDMAALIRRCNPKTPSGLRNRALLMLMWRGGVRIGEAVGRHHKRTGRWLPGLTVKDLDLANGLVRITYGKGNRRQEFKARTAAIDPGCAAALEAWIAKRRELGIPRGAQLFCTISDDGHRYGHAYRPLTGAYVRNLLKRLAERCELERRVHPHALRHTHAFELSMEGQPMNLIQHQLGHTSLATTGRYLDHIAPQARAAAMASRTLPPELDDAA